MVTSNLKAFCCKDIPVKLAKRLTFLLGAGDLVKSNNFNQQLLLLTNSYSNKHGCPSPFHSCHPSPSCGPPCRGHPQSASPPGYPPPDCSPCRHPESPTPQGHAPSQSHSPGRHPQGAPPPTHRPQGQACHAPPPCHAPDCRAQAPQTEDDHRHHAPRVQRNRRQNQRWPQEG